jgi:hypothetical protein
VALDRDYWRAQVYFTTMPIGTFQRAGDVLVGDPRLWQPLIAELAAAEAASFARWPQWWDDMLRRGVRIPRLMPAPVLYEIAEPRLPAEHTRQYVCDHCRVLYAGFITGRPLTFCSDRCRRLRRNSRQRARRAVRPRTSAVINARRTAQRAEARAGRTCEYCGRAIEAARATKRFCSGLCRVRHHRSRYSPGEPGPRS